MTDTFQFNERKPDTDGVKTLPNGVRVTLTDVDPDDLDALLRDYGEALGDDGSAFLREAANAVEGDSFDFTFFDLEPAAGRVSPNDLSNVKYVDRSSAEMPTVDVFINGEPVGGTPDDTNTVDTSYDFFV